MKRLTERDEYGNADIIGLSDVMPELYAGLSFSETNALTDALNRLAAYEDTEFLPKEIEMVLDSYGRGMTLRTDSEERLQTIQNIPIDRLKEIANAAEDGSLVILPLKVGDTVWFIKSAFSIAKSPIEANNVSIRQIYKNGEIQYSATLVKTKTERRFVSTDIGKNVFLTRDGAEEALK